MNEPQKFYTVISCRWAWTNNGFQVHTVTPDLDAAIECADGYCEYRGGKYGVGVFDETGKQVYHAPSCYGEKEIHRNHRMDKFEAVGLYVVVAIEKDEPLNPATIIQKWEQACQMEKIMENNSPTKTK